MPTTPTIDDLTPAKAALAIRKLQMKQIALEAQSALERAECRRRIISIARDLLPKAAGFARKGRPRLLAVLTKIISDDKMRSVHELKK